MPVAPFLGSLLLGSGGIVDSMALLLQPTQQKERVVVTAVSSRGLSMLPWHFECIGSWHSTQLKGFNSSAAWPQQQTSDAENAHGHTNSNTCTGYVEKPVEDKSWGRLCSIDRALCITIFIDHTMPLGGIMYHFYAITANLLAL